MDEEEMPKIGNFKVKIIIMDQCGVDIVRDLNIFNLIVRKRQMNKQIQLKLSELIYFYRVQIHWLIVIIFSS